MKAFVALIRRDLALALRIGGDKLQPKLQEMRVNLRSKRYA